ncbi:hypothetical protein NHF40_01455 [Maricaulaceae bacterium EIL42A08]|nr:hypothetical protein [Maricaulaceae bacterium EIL42A08]MCP2679076.1 hypothetical protein [Maricaulaceae bacterium NA33B04]
MVSLPRQFGEETTRVITGERSGIAAVHERVYALVAAPQQGEIGYIRYAFLQANHSLDTGLTHGCHTLSQLIRQAQKISFE